MAKTPKNKGKYPPNDWLWWIITIACFCTGVLWWAGLLLIYLNTTGRLPPLNAERRRAIEGSIRKGLSTAQEQMNQITEQKKNSAPRQPAQPQRQPRQPADTGAVTEIARPEKRRATGKDMAVIGGICSGALAIGFAAVGIEWTY